MNENPWHVYDEARMQRERVQEEMRQIRLQEQALEARGRRPGLLPQLWRIVSRWLEARNRRRAESFEQRPLTAIQAKHHSEI